MTDDLHELLSRRADRAPAPADPAAVADTVVGLAERRSHRNRGRLAVASGAAVVVAAAAVGIAVADSGAVATRHHAAQQQTGAKRHRVIVQGPDAVHVLPELTLLHGPNPTADHSTLLERARQRALAQRAAEKQARAARRAQQRRADGGTLVPIAPAPSDAEISIGLVPQGVEYLSLDDADTFYGLPGTPPGDYFSDGIVVDVHQFVGSAKDYTLTVNGMPAAFYHRDGYTTVRVRYSKHVDVGFQAPPATHLTEKQALRIAGTIDVRSTKDRTHG